MYMVPWNEVMLKMSISKMNDEKAFKMYKKIWDKKILRSKLVEKDFTDDIFSDEMKLKQQFCIMKY